ncbi:bifunctional NADP phosphatase/NAD kinase [Methanocaldococcus indicus]|uniref:bifunctional NADP phosphatase/NAD kinase n=1 Tax=Methanocaldococcus indicus TaxID=213231 RepID=UPI003C6CF1DE
MLDVALKLVNEIDKRIQPIIGWENAGKTVKIGADGTPTKMIDIIAENIAINVLEKYGGILLSEEIGLKVLGDEINYIYILDPIDGTYNALKNIPVYSTSVGIIKIKEEDKKILKNKDIKFIEKYLYKNYSINDVYLGVVKSLATKDKEVFYAIKNKGAYLIKGDEKIKLSVSKVNELKKASVGLFVYGLSNELLDMLKDRLFRRIRLFGSISLEMCFVANKALDAYINLNESARLFDIAGSYIICKESNAKITDKNGKELNLPISISSKTSLIIANEELHKKLLPIFSNKWAIKPLSFGFVVREDSKEAINLAKDLINYLKSKNIPCYVKENIKNLINEEKINIKKISHIVAIGGDGTILRAARIANGEPIPIISINMGKLGFLAEFDKENAKEAINKVIKGDYEIERRIKLDTIINSKKLPSALNEVVIITKNPAKILHFEIYVNDTLVDDLRADGLIISTPTGSTAYSLSAGGPIVEPTNNNFIITPICPFKLNFRPLVLSCRNIIKVRLKSNKPALIAVDGIVEEEIKKDDIVMFKKSDEYTYFVKGKNFYEKLKNIFLN